MPGLTDAILSERHVRVAIAAFMDIAGDPLRYAISPAPLILPPTSILDDPDPDFDGQHFETISQPGMIDISAVTHGDGGAESVTFTLSGALEIDSPLMNELSDPSKFWGRQVKMWLIRLDENYQPTHARPHYVGYMSVPSYYFQPGSDGEPAQQTIQMATENYLALIGSGAPARSLMSSPDPDDMAASASAGSTGTAVALGITYSGGGSVADLRGLPRKHAQ